MMDRIRQILPAKPEPTFTGKLFSDLFCAVIGITFSWA